MIAWILGPASPRWMETRSTLAGSALNASITALIPYRTGMSLSLDQGDRLRRDPIASAFGVHPFGRCGFDADLFLLNPQRFCDPPAHLGHERGDLRLLGDQDRIDVAHDPTCLKQP